MAEWSEIKKLVGGLDTDTAPEYIAQGDFIDAVNMRLSGTSGGEAGYRTNIESTLALPTTGLPSGINRCIGGRAFEDIQQIVYFIYNSAGFNQIRLYDFAGNTDSAIYTDKTDSGSVVLLPLNPQNYVNCQLVDNTYLIFWAAGIEVGYTNLQTLASGGYAPTVLAEDLLLLKPQCLVPITGVYGSDAGQPANYLYGYLPQFNVQYVNNDFNYSAWSTWSKRIVPYQENTPTLGTDVSQNNYITVSAYMGSIRANVVNIACRFGTDVFKIIKSVNRSYVLALPNTAVNVGSQIFEGYNPTTNIYQFAFYSNSVSIPVSPTDTDLTYDYIWPANSGEVVNGNIIGLGDLSVGYPRPAITVQISAGGYDPNIAIPAGSLTNPLVLTKPSYGSQSFGNNYFMFFTLGGSPKTGDHITVQLVSPTNATSTEDFSYTVPSAQNGNLLAVVQSVTSGITTAAYKANGDGTYTISFVAVGFKGKNFSVQLFFGGAAVANSIPSILDNSNGQLAASFRDIHGRFLPLDTDNTFLYTTPSYAQVTGQAVQISWAISGTPPKNAVDFQWLITKPEINQLVDVIATPINYVTGWNAKTNTPPLSPNFGNVGDAYQITTPCDPSDTAHYTNLGTGEAYKTGDYVTYNGTAWVILSKDFGDLTSTGNILAFSLNSLNLFNSEYANQGVANTTLAYDFVQGDRCTLHYYIDGTGNKQYINNPCVNVAVFGYDVGTNIVKVEKTATFDTTVLSGKNVFLRLYSPAPQNQTTSTTQNDTVWYEIGERFTITNGAFDTLNGALHDGGVYYKTRQFADALKPYTNPPVQVIATDLNYSDFYPSAFYSFGRPRTYYDELEVTERKAIIITSQNYITGSKINGLTRFFPADIYGEADGQTSSSHGGIQILHQRGDVLIAVQERGVFYIPVNYAYTVLNAQLTGQSISEKLLNNGRYDTKGIGIGLAKESFCYRYDVCFFIDPNKSEPMQMSLGGIEPISGKKSKYFKGILQLAYSQGKKLVMYYDNFYEEVVLTIQTDNGVLVLFPFSAASWQVGNGFAIAPSDITSVATPANATVSVDGSGNATYTPNTGFVGNTVGAFEFNANGAPETANNCLTWTAGTSTVNGFAFAPKTGQPIATEIQSNSILVSGNNIPVPISITGGMYSINGGAFTASAGTVNANDVVIVEVLSSGGYSTAASTTLTISGISATFTATTGTQPVVNWSMVEQTHPYADTNAKMYSGGTLVNTVGVTSSGSTLLTIGQLFSVNMFNQFYPTGLNPTQTMIVRKTTGGIQSIVYPATTIPASGGLAGPNNETYADTVAMVINDVYAVTWTSAATPYPSAFTVLADGAMTITNVVNSGGSAGVPAGYSGLSIPPGTYASMAYTTLSSGNISVTITGFTAGYTLTLFVNDVIVSTASITAAGTYVLTNPSSVGTPTSVFIAIRNY